ncbi:MAG: thioesterase family protein [Pseudomonadota bacterium]
MDLPFLTPLSTEQLRDAGVQPPWTFGMADRVRFGEIDVLGHVNNAVYLRWFENLRIRYFEAYGADVSARPKLVLRNIGLDFKAEVKLGDDYILTGRTVELRRTSFTMHYAVHVDGNITTSGHAVIVFLTSDNHKLPIPDDWRSKLIEVDGATQA